MSGIRKLLESIGDDAWGLGESEQVDEVQGYRPGRGHEWDQVTNRIKADKERFDREGPNEIERWKQEVEQSGYRMEEKYDGYYVYDDAGELVGEFGSDRGKWLKGSKEFPLHGDEVAESRNVRENTIALHQLMDEGVMDPRTVADAALNYMSESEVTDMIRANDWWLGDDEDEDMEVEGLGEDPWGIGE